MESLGASGTREQVEYYVPLVGVDLQRNPMPAVPQVETHIGPYSGKQGSGTSQKERSCSFAVALLPEEMTTCCSVPTGQLQREDDTKAWPRNLEAQEACRHRPCIWRCIVVMTFALLAAAGIVLYPLLQPHLPWTDDHALGLAAFLALLGILTSVMLAGFIGSWPVSCSACSSSHGSSSKQFITSADV